MMSISKDSLPSRIGSYEVRGIAGRGAMAVVYDAWDAAHNRRVAVKVFRPEAEADLADGQIKELLLRFETEAKAASRIDNRHVIDIYDAGDDAGRHFIAMEFIEGTNLKELLELGTHFTLADVSDIVLQVAEGLDAIHSLGIVHRDIKPANIVRTAEGRIFITDFGIVKISEDATLSQEGSIVGTPNYMSPEQILGSHKARIGSQSDIFSLGVVTYELLTRRKPFEGKDIAQTMYNITHVHPASPLIYNPELPRAIEPILFRSLSKKPEDRYERATDFSTALARIEQEERIKNITIGGALGGQVSADAGTDGFSADAAGDGERIPLYIKRQQAKGEVGAVPDLPEGRPATAYDLGKPVYCTECGMENSQKDEYCVRCGLKLLKRSEFFNELKRTGRIASNPAIPLVYIIVNSIAVLVLILVLWLFLKSG